MLGETKDFVSVKKLMADKGDWACEKDIFGWLINTEVVTVALTEQKHLELLQLIVIPVTQRRMGWKKLVLLVGKLHYMHLTVSGVVAHNITR